MAETSPPALEAQTPAAAPLLYREPKVTLIARTQFLGAPHMEWITDTDSPAEQLAEFAGRLCYMSFGKGRKTNREYLANILESAHGSVLEHSCWTFLIENVSRSFTHELVRHRAGWAYSQLSQRYVDESEAGFVIPAIVDEDEQLRGLFTEVVRRCQQAYVALVEGLSEKLGGMESKTLKRKMARQAARSVLPNATETKIVATANARAWRHFINMRASEHAEVEIRAVAVAILRILQREAPNIFGDYTIIQASDGTEIASSPYGHV